MNNCHPNTFVRCIPSADECGVRVVVASDVAIARTCNEINYTVTVTNNSDQVMKNVFLTIPLDNALALMPNTVVVNGTTIDVDTLNQIPLDDIEVGATATLTYTVTVMVCQRYIRTQAKVNFLVCCCFMKKNLCVTSNTNCVQVCCCCGNNAA
ncbi:MAG: hypothetical protein SOW55_00230 [Bacilli bacterium]|nr:hypothetical protein [Bacilli bacterium]